MHPRLHPVAFFLAFFGANAVFLALMDYWR
jgi:hypothetical protein